jgi:hypothetical protein
MTANERRSVKGDLTPNVRVDMPLEEARRLSDLNLASYLLHAARHAPGGGAEERDGLILFAGGHPNPGPYINGVLRLDSRVPAPEVLAAAERFFSPRGRGYAVWIREHADADLEGAVRAARFPQRPPVVGQPGIAIDAAIPRDKNPSVEIRPVVDERGAQDYLRVVGEAWGMIDSPAELVWAMFLQPAAVLAPRATAFVAYEEGLPAGGSMLFMADDVAGIYWAGRARAAKSPGLGTACFVACVDAGFKLGARLAVAQSSLKGTPIWESLGFEVITHYRRYIAPPPSA